VWEVVCIYRTERCERELEEEYLPWLGLQINIIMDEYCVLNSLTSPGQSSRRSRERLEHALPERPDISPSSFACGTDHAILS